LRVIELDLFRFIAAFGVVLYHYVAWFSSDYPQGSIVIDNIAELTQFGFLGVPLFFMISGFVILASAMHRTSTEFVASRIARLYPVYWLCVSITGLFILMEADIDKPLELKTYLINLTMLQSFIGVGSLDGVYS
jgi:peptidoglycan/LPS O-acetylase OafA/YrhL